MSFAISLAERSLVPDALIRRGIRRLLRARIEEERANGFDLAMFMAERRREPIAIHTDDANEQHYELPTAFFTTVLGPHLKYSSALWPEGCRDLGEAEAHMLATTCERAELADGQDILELGCGWGSLTLWMAEHYPRARIRAVSNSATQRAHIEAEAARRGLDNLRVETCDINEFNPGDAFDRVVSVEMFEHMRNHAELMSRVASWLKPDGKLFVHIFTHRDLAYLFRDQGDPRNWMARHFFAGGMMPSEDLLPAYDRDLVCERRWSVNGQHYAKTLEAWLAKQDENRKALMPLFRETYGDDALVWFGRWRLFFLACAELFAAEGGEEWRVTHYRFTRRPSP